MKHERVHLRAPAARTVKRRFRGNRIAGLVAVGLAAAFGIAGAESVAILQDGDISSWKERRFRGSTVYKNLTLDGRRALRASSKASASGFFLKVRVDLEKTPILHWSWRVEVALNELDERTRTGDDYSARIYLIRKHPLLFWRTIALNYVWSSSQPVGATWPSAYTNNVRMVAVRSGNSEAGLWIDERRDVRADFRTLFGRHVRYIDGIAVMTDTDNSGGTAVAYYGDIRFASE